MSHVMPTHAKIRSQALWPHPGRILLMALVPLGVALFFIGEGDQLLDGNARHMTAPQLDLKIFATF